jgi:transcriptional regulator with XRE-family HTH domain
MSEQTRQALGRRIRALRTERGLSQRKLSLMLGIDRSYIIGIELGRKNPTVDSLEKIAAGLGVTLSELFEITE